VQSGGHKLTVEAGAKFNIFTALFAKFSGKIYSGGETRDEAVKHIESRLDQLSLNMQIIVRAIEEKLGTRKLLLILEDLDKIEGDIELTFAAENEPPVRLLGEPEARAPKPGEVIYKDRISAICRRWNWKEADRTKFTEETKNGILIIEGFDRNLVEKAIHELEELVRIYCGGNVRAEIVSSTNPEMAL